MNSVSSQCNFGELEWRVVEMAREDGPRSLNPDGFLARVSRKLFGFPGRRLANEGLETLRRFCVRAWYWDVIRIRDLRALTDAGYSSSDAKQILAHVARYRGFVPSLQEGAA